MWCYHYRDFKSNKNSRSDFSRHTRCLSEECILMACSLNAASALDARDKADNARDKAHDQTTGPVTEVTPIFAPSDFFPFFPPLPHDWWSHYSDVHVGCITHPCVFGNLFRRRFVASITIRRSFVTRTENFHFYSTTGMTVKKKRRERTKEKFKCGEKYGKRRKKKRLVTKLWERLDIRSNRHVWRR